MLLPLVLALAIMNGTVLAATNPSSDCVATDNGGRPSYHAPSATDKYVTVACVVRGFTSVYFSLASAPQIP